MNLAIKKSNYSHFKVISAKTIQYVTAGEVITTTLKIISATTKVILATQDVITATLNSYLSRYKSDLSY